MKTIVLLFTFLINLSVYSQSNGFEKDLDNLFKNNFSEKTPGCSVLISQNGEVVYKKAFGCANLELNVPLESKSVFSIASITKQFTAVSILQLVEKGKIDLDDPLEKYIESFKGKNIRIHHLLSHTSGLKDYLQVETNQKFGERMDYTPIELISVFEKLPLEFEPGTAYKYCNSDYILLGFIIEKVSGLKYADYLKKNIFEPLKMEHTYYDSDENIIPNRVSGYFKDGDNYKKAEFWSATIGYSAGGLLSDTADLEKWNNGLMSYSILSKELLNQAVSSYKLKDGTLVNYGFGWNINSDNPIKKIDHGGNKNGFTSYAGYFPEKNLYVVLLFNSEDAPRDELSIRVPEIMIGKSFQTKIALTDENLKKYIGKYQLVSDPGRTITITKEKTGLVAAISGQGKFNLIFQSQTQFQFSNLLDAHCEFRLSGENTESIIVKQNGTFEWRKIR
ncbi:serine hydrolase [Flavobacterium crocinum]|uniref:Serine hydrolase n=1 Tax=Flavobacterium crocinum TaxID=2183896 RepID=A0A2S1YPM4_9FLAO|nr:serine hydrolase domain-containing protein [Flavobacterium crocinum]AWK05768.1 serine hydrolase [Flavobacterium crocinum]